MTTPSSPSRRRFLGGALATGGVLLAAGAGPRRVAAQRSSPPGIPFGIQAGEVTADQAIVWSATDRPARLLVEHAATERFQNPQRVVGPAALPQSGYTAKVTLTGLPPDQDVFYRVTFLGLGDMKTTSAPVVGRLRTAPVDGRRDARPRAGDRGHPPVHQAERRAKRRLDHGRRPLLQFTDFEPFYEFVSGPIHAGAAGPNELDDTFGPQVIFTRNPAGRANTPPTEGGLYFGPREWCSAIRGRRLARG